MFQLNVLEQWLLAFPEAHLGTLGLILTLGSLGNGPLPLLRRKGPAVAAEQEMAFEVQFQGSDGFGEPD